MTDAVVGPDRPYVVVIGGGKVGFYLARHLIERDYEVTLVEKDPTRAEWIEHQMGSVAVMVGDGDEMALLATTGIERAGVVIACTGDDEDNLVACQLAKGKFRVPRTIARVNNPVNVNVFTALGIDAPVSATELLMGLIEAEISGSEMVRGLAVMASGANLVDVKLPDMSRLVGKRLSEVDLPAGDTVVCIVRAGEPVLAGPDEVIEASDELIVYSRQLDIEGVRESVSR
jgi:trk system potassium uptake protein TrkA